MFIRHTATNGVHFSTYGLLYNAVAAVAAVVAVVAVAFL